jgi:hypothetical protein
VSTANNQRLFLTVWILIGVMAVFLGLWASVGPDDSTANVLGVILIVAGIALAGSSLWMRLQLDESPVGGDSDLAP